MIIHPITLQERSHLLEVATRTKLFSLDEAESLLGGVVDGLIAQALPEGHQAASCRLEEDTPIIGWCYFAPDDHAEGVWNLWWIGVEPSKHGAGAGRAMLKFVEKSVMEAGGRLLVIETSDAPAQERARRFYALSGYSECGRIPHFYRLDDSKVIFARSLAVISDRPQSMAEKAAKWIGICEGGPADLSTNPKYMEDFGK